MSAGIAKAEKSLNKHGSTMYADPEIQLLRRKKVTTPIIEAISETNAFEHDLKVDRKISYIAALVLGVAGIALTVAGFMPGTPSSFVTMGVISALLGSVIGVMNYRSENEFDEKLGKISQASNQDAFSVITFSNAKKKRKGESQNVNTVDNKQKGKKNKEVAQPVEVENSRSYTSGSDSDSDSE